MEIFLNYLTISP